MNSYWYSNSEATTVSPTTRMTQMGAFAREIAQPGNLGLLLERLESLANKKEIS